MKLKLKQEGIKMSLVHPIIGRVIFDSEIVNESEYEFYYNSGFENLFEEVIIKPIKYKGIENGKTEKK